jgi:DNA-binding NarL/FixJ family response regulator
MVDLPDTPLRLIVADNSEFARVGIQAALRALGLEGVRLAGTLPAAVRLLDEDPADVILIDMGFGSPAHPGRDLFRAASDRNTVTVAMGTHLNVAQISEALYLGAGGFLAKDSSPSQWLRAIHIAASGELAYPRAVLPLLVEGLRRSTRPLAAGTERQLTAREWQVLRGIADGLTNRAIAARLHISPETVASHVSNILGKLDAPTRAAAAARFHTMPPHPAEHQLAAL